MNNNSKKLKWNDLFSTIIKLHKQGLNSREIAKEVGRPKGDRHIRKVITKHKKEDYRVSQYAKVLLFDLETAPMKAYTFNKWQTNINDNDIINDWFVLCWSAKWLFDDEIISSKLTKKELADRDDSRIMLTLWNMINEADILIAHNLQRFDKKKANTRFFKHGFNPPRPYQSIDTLLTARKQFSITSNRLDYLAKFLGIEGKLDTPKGMWFEVMEGNYEMLNEMSVYCDQDIRVLEDVYLRMRPWVQPHPNIGLLEQGTPEVRCCNCGSNELKEDGEYHTTVQVYQVLRCGSCGALNRGRKTLLAKNSSSFVMSSVPSR